MAVKPHTFRADEEVVERLKTISEELGCSQGQALEEFITLWETQKLKQSVPTRQAELDRFTTAVKVIQDLYKNSVSMWTDAYEQAKGEVSKQMEQLRTNNSNLLQESNRLTEEIKKKDKEMESLRDQLKSKDETIKALETQVKSLESLGSLTDRIMALKKAVEDKETLKKKP